MSLKHLARRSLIPAAVLLATVLAWSAWPRLERLVHPVQPAAFTLVDGTGAQVRDTDFRGKVMVIYFGYTSCPDICPTTLLKVVRAYSGLSPDNQAKVAPIFVTVDPERDTTATIGDYVSSFSPALVGLTGSPEQVSGAERAYHVYAAKSAGEGDWYTMDHSSLLYIVGKDGRLAKQLKGDASPNEIEAAIRDVL